MKIIFENNKLEKKTLDDKYSSELHCYIHSQGVRDCIFVIPGGAYGGICVRENKPIAERFYKMGYNTFYINYSVGQEVMFPTMINECRTALNHIFLNAESLNVNDKNIFLMGFSAGGHLAGLVENYFDEKTVDLKVTPKGVIYGYPVVSTEKEIIHERSFRNLLKGEYDSLLEKVDLSKLINQKSSKSFIFLCEDDREVNYINSIKLFESYLSNKVSSELHVFKSGGHGVAIPTLECFNEEELKYVNQDLEIWIELVDRWIKNVLRSKL